MKSQRREQEVRWGGGGAVVRGREARRTQQAKRKNMECNVGLEIRPCWLQNRSSVTVFLGEQAFLDLRGGFRLNWTTPKWTFMAIFGVVLGLSTYK